MKVTVNLSGRLVDACDGHESLVAEGATVREVVDSLIAAYPAIEERLLGGARLRPYINVYVDDEDIRLLEGLETELSEGVELSFLPAIAGGEASWI